MRQIEETSSCEAKGLPPSAFRFPLSALRGFTLIEMLIVVAVVGMLMAGVFKLIGLAGENAAKAKTVARLQRVQNALAAYYAEYGMYPPVKAHSDTNPYHESASSGDSTKYNECGGLVAVNARRAAGAYSVAFSYPPASGLNKYIEETYKGELRDPNNDVSTGAGPNWPSPAYFKFGLLSYLLPRLCVLGFNEHYFETGADAELPKDLFFDTAQWKRNNTSTSDRGSLRAQFVRERTATAKWLPQLEGIVAIGEQSSELFGVRIKDDDAGIGTLCFDGSVEVLNSGHALATATIDDGWGRSLYYYSAPPYQSYRLWSAGEDGNTFPPWVSLETIKREKGVGDVEKVRGWTEDDIIRFDR